MASSSENISMAVFCDFENVALGVRDANYEKFDIKPVFERLLLKGSIVVKKAYCDWDRYKSFKGTMHEANFELIEIPHVRQSGKNSADIRMVVDALDLCYTKSHVDTFVIISGDSDFSPLVSKLRENNKRVIGVGVKQSTSDLLVANCDEFIFYDDLVREVRRAAAKRDERKAQPSPSRRPSDESNRKKEEMEARKLQALEMVVETFDALVSERGDTGKIWASLLKDTLKRRRPDFSETYYGFRTFGNLLEEAQTRGLFEFGRDEKSGTYVYRTSGQTGEALGGIADVEQLVAPEPVTDASDENEAGLPLEQAAAEAPAQAPTPAPPQGREPRGRGRGRGRKGREQQFDQQVVQSADASAADSAMDDLLGNWPAPTPDLAEAQAPELPEAQAPALDAPPVEPSPVEALIDVAAAAAAAAGHEASPATGPGAGAEANLEPAQPPKERRRTARAPRKPAARKTPAPAAAGVDAAAADAIAVAPAALDTASTMPVTDAKASANPAQDDAAVATDAVAAVGAGGAVASGAGTAANAEAPDAVDDAVADAGAEGEGAQDDKPGRKKSSRPSHKAPTRKPAARTRRPAKPKTTPENG